MNAEATDPQVLEPVAARAWPAAETAAIGGWRLHASSGFSGRINACWPVAAPDRSIEAAIRFVEAWYAKRGLPPVFKIVDRGAEPAALVSGLAALGYRPRTETVMMTGPLTPAADEAVRLSEQPDDGFRAVFVAANPGAAGDADERLSALRQMPQPRAFARVELGGDTVGIGACASEGPFSGIFAMRTDPRHRRQGVARRIVGALMAAAADAGATNAYLQVEADNTPARRLYEEAGLTEAYRYRYWRRF